MYIKSDICIPRYPPISMRCSSVAKYIINSNFNLIWDIQTASTGYCADSWYVRTSSNGVQPVTGVVQLDTNYKDIANSILPANNNTYYTSQTHVSSAFNDNSFYLAKEWLKNEFIDKVNSMYSNHLKTPYDPIYAHQNLKHINVMEYIIKNNWDISWDYIDASIPNSCDANTYICTSSNGTLQRRRRY